VGRVQGSRIGKAGLFWASFATEQALLGSSAFRGEAEMPFCEIRCMGAAEEWLDFDNPLKTLALIPEAKANEMA